MTHISKYEYRYDPGTYHLNLHSKTLYTKVMMFFQDNPESWYSSVELTQQFGQSTSAILQSLARKNYITRRLLPPKKDIQSANILP